MSAELPEIEVDKENLYREENFTDMKVLSLRKLTPIKVDGSDDDSRKTMFMGQTHIMSQSGPVPINVRIEADELADAIEKFPAAAKESIEKMIEEVKEMQRQEASRIVVPGEKPAGGNIQLG